MPDPRYRKAFTLAEMMVYTAVISIAVAMFASYMTGFIKTARGSEKKMEGSASLRLALARMEGDLYEANEFLSVSSSSVTFICDMLKNPGWDPDADSDGDGTPDIKDTDMDDDAQLKFSLPRDTQWRSGYNLEDDDEDNDGRLDVRVRIYLSSSILYRELYVNEELYRTDELAADISSFTVAVRGSRREDLGKNIDLGQDGAAGTGDAGEGDGVISEREIDRVLPPAGHGDRSGAVDTADELKYVVSVAVHLESDPDRNGAADAQLDTEIMPPLLPLKRRR